MLTKPKLTKPKVTLGVPFIGVLVGLAPSVVIVDGPVRRNGLLDTTERGR
jgi:hypothetical protein